MGDQATVAVPRDRIITNTISTTFSPRTPIAHRRRPRRPPFLLVLSEGVGVTSSIRPIFIPERARARRADCAPGPGVFVPLPSQIN